MKQKEEKTYLYSCPVITGLDDLDDNYFQYYMILTKKQAKLLLKTYNKNAREFENEGDCCGQTRCFACLTSGLKFQIDQMKIVFDYHLKSNLLKMAQVIVKDQKEYSFSIEQLIKQSINCN